MQNILNRMIAIILWLKKLRILDPGNEEAKTLEKVKQAVKDCPGILKYYGIKNFDNIEFISS